jgi:glucose uptake protein GlcU
MTITTENQAAILIHKWQGIASSIIGVTSIIFNLLLVGIAMSGTNHQGP